ncbi:hypothetical protein PRJH_1026 [Providencia rustigianii]
MQPFCRGMVQSLKFYLRWWVVQDYSGFALALRVVAASATLSRFARLEPERSFSPTLNVQCVNSRVVYSWGVSLRWWVVQDLSPSDLHFVSNLQPSCRGMVQLLKLYLRWWVVQDYSGFALALRVVAASATLSHLARLEPDRSFSPTLNVQYVNGRVVYSWGVSLRWWVVQDSNLRPID